MKPLAALAVFIFLAPAVMAAEKDVLPLSGLNGSGEGFCIKVREIPGVTACFNGGHIPDFPVDLIKDTIRSSTFGIGFWAANAYFPPPLTPQQERQRELGRKVMEAAPRLAFPELGDPVMKDTPAVAYCSSSAGNDVLDPFNAQTVKVTGKGRCEDFMTIYLRDPGKP